MARKPVQAPTYPVSPGRWFEYDEAVHGAQEPEGAGPKPGTISPAERDESAEENPQAVDLDSKVAGAVQ